MNELALFNSLFDDFRNDDIFMPSLSLKKAYMPKVDVKESENSYVLQMDLPGKTEKDVDVELHNNVLTISSTDESKKEEKSDRKSEEKWLIRERTYTHFSRSFSLPDDVDGEKLEATVKNGILTVNMPRKAIAVPKKIAIKAE